MRIDLSTVEFLVIDDNQFTRKLTREILRGFGAREVRDVESITDALNAIAQRRPDIILCDWMMHPLDGLFFLKSLRAGSRSDIPVIMISRHATNDHVAAAMGEGANSYIVKPFRAITLLEHIVKIIDTADEKTERI